jgi:mycothiol synthase
MSMELRPFADGDLGPVVAFYNSVSRALRGDNATSESEFQTWLTTPGVEPARDIRLALHDGVIVGYTDVFDENKWHTRFWGDLTVHPSGGGGDATDALVAWAESRAREEALPDAFFRYWIDERASFVADVLERRGFRRIRSSFRMQIELDGAIPEPEWPEGVSVRTFRDGDAERVWEMHEECFADHWEHVREPFEEWAHWNTEREGFDPTLAFLAEAGGELAGYALCRPHDGQPEIAFVHLLGVRRPWRQRGVALALLRHAFREFQARGFEKAGLGVDSENLTGAVRLYERAGMHVERRHDCYELRL